MGGKPDTPATPDYTALAQQQASQQQQLLQQQTQANRPTQINPMGTSQWTQDANGNWTQNTSLSPTMQGLWNQYTGNIAQQGGAAGGMLSQFTANNPNYTGVEQGILNQSTAINPASAQAAFMSLMQPELTAQQNSTRANLAAQGITTGSQAGNMAENILSQNQNNAEAQSIVNSGTWANQQQQNLASQYNLANALRTNPLQDYQTLMTGTQVSQPSFSNFTNAGVAQAPNLMQAAQTGYQANLAAANAGTAQGQGIGNALGSVVGGVAGSFFGPVGTVAGSGMGGALGGMMGGLF
jgi:hypothetical protein